MAEFESISTAIDAIDNTAVLGGGEVVFKERAKGGGDGLEQLGDALGDGLETPAFWKALPESRTIMFSHQKYPVSSNHIYGSFDSNIHWATVIGE